MESNSENTSDANGVHLEDNYLFSHSFFDRCRITFFYNWLKDAL